MGVALVMVVGLSAWLPRASWGSGDDAEPGGLHLNRLEVARRLEDRLPLDTQGPFVADGERLYIWLEVANPGQPEVVTVRWHEVEHDRHLEQTIEVGTSRRWRTWVYQALRPRLAGRWHVEVLGPDGALLGQVDFEAVAPSGQAAGSGG